ncbi:phage regulatory CII family protein [Aliarcobacter butzleri]|uniref:phage regulatory CII family protein n=1 Tax=Aliarcobacter butzleri TaxID=28197 RepID=UPI0021B1BA31|nr:phage regulatory CII family protein [Aliarcobacter butzleri]MCT7596413.1 phage regulatory CII family protein [Aliarcobacter butzleri]
MKDYLSNKQSKDSRFLALFKKAFNKDRLRNEFSRDEAANEMGLSSGTLEQKLKPSADNDITVTEWNHHLELTGDFTTLEYFVSKHGFELKKLNLLKTAVTIHQINIHADNAMKESNEAWAKIKTSIKGKKLNKQEKFDSLREIDEAIKALQQLQQDVQNKEIEE